MRIPTDFLLTHDNIFTYGDDTNEPCLPIMSLAVKMPKDSKYKSFTQSYKKTLLLSNVLVGANPTQIPSNQEYTSSLNVSRINYIKSKYPQYNAQYISTASIGDSSVLYFQICPFEYDVINKNLYLVEDINININTINDNQNPIIEQQKFINFCNTHNINLANKISMQSLNNNVSDSIDYIIITSKELSYYFQSFVEWKNTKGVRTIVATIEEIEEMDRGSKRSLADKIKAYLLYMYHIKNYKFKYLLLGGDDTVVPAKYCLGKVGTRREQIPSDIYYACLDYTTDPFWDSSNNGVFGEIEDNINFSQNIYVTRLPVRTSTDVKTILMKIMDYERNPLAHGWNNNILMSGVKLRQFDSDSLHSDAELLGDTLYYKYIKKYWNGERFKLYDTFSDFKSDGIESLTNDNFQSVLSKGFAFIDMITHGNYTTWSMPKDSYNVSYAQNMQSNQYSVITTIACNSNAFDKAEPCLSEAFIRNPFSGVIAYFGSSSYGWFIPGNFNSGSSIDYEKRFYKYLFDNTLTDKNFGKVVAYAKSSMLGLCNKYNSQRWLQFGLNPIGDAEMPIYTTTPQQFKECCISQSNDNMYINTGVDSCKICILSSDDEGKSFYKILRNVREYQLNDFDPSIEYTICVTKQNFVPYVWNTRNVKNANNQITFCGVDNNTLTINTLLDNDVKTAYVNISDINGNKERSYTISSDNTIVKDDNAYLDNGIHIISLFVNDKLVDSKQIKK